MKRRNNPRKGRRTPGTMYSRLDKDLNPIFFFSVFFFFFFHYKKARVKKKSKKNKNKNGYYISVNSSCISLFTRLGVNPFPLSMDLYSSPRVLFRFQVGAISKQIGPRFDHPSLFLCRFIQGVEGNMAANDHAVKARKRRCDLNQNRILNKNYGRVWA
jgi:hypothetical protein